MFKLETGMIVEFCDGDVGIVINDKICCNSCYVSFSKHDMFDLDNYDEEDIIWSRKQQLKEGDVFICTNLISAGVYHVNVNQYYLKTEDDIVMVDKSILPYLKGDVKEIS